MIELKHIHLSFKNNILFENQEISIPQQKITLITGQSGCGKSTLLFEMARLTHYCQCDYYFNHQLLVNYDHDDLFKKERIAFVFQDCRLFEELTALQNIELYAQIAHSQCNKKKVMELIDDFHLNIDLNSNIKKLSGGEKQRLLILCCVMKNPDIIFLDEPTSYLDHDNRKEIRKILLELSKKYHKTVVIASHDLDMLEIADVHYHIENKQIILKKNCESFFTKDDNQKRIQTYPVQFYLNAMKKNRIHLKRNIVVTVLMIVVTHMMCFQMYYKNTVDEFINQAILNELRISYNSGGNAYDIAGITVSQLLIQDLKNHTMVKSIAPFYEWNVLNLVVDHKNIEEVVIQPYMNYQKMKAIKTSKKHILTIGNQNFDKYKIYISSSLYHRIKQKQINIEGSIQICKNNQLEFVNLPFTLSNADILDDSIYNRYTKTTENIIYLPENLCYEITNKLIKDYTYRSNVYLLELNSYTDALSVQKFIENHDNDIHVFNPVSDTILTKTSSFGYKMVSKFAKIAFIIFIMTCLFIAIFDTIRNRFQYAILMVNGLKKKDCVQIIFQQRLLYTVMSYIISCIMVLLIFYIQYQILTYDIIKYVLLILSFINSLIIAVPCLSFIILFIIKKPGETLKTS